MNVEEGPLASVKPDINLYLKVQRISLEGFLFSIDINPRKSFDNAATIYGQCFRYAASSAVSLVR